VSLTLVGGTDLADLGAKKSERGRKTSTRADAIRCLRFILKI